MKACYLAAYDTESERCMLGLREIVRIHRAHNAPATFYCVGELFSDPEWAAEAKDLLGDPLFSVQSHTFTHCTVRPIPAWEADETHKQSVLDEVRRTNEILEKAFGKAPVGFRTPGGYPDGLGRDGWLLHGLWREGIRFSSSQLTGPEHSSPAPLANPYWNVTDLLRPILEMPAHDWHENILKGHNGAGSYVCWPPNLPWGYPASLPKTCAEEFAVYKHGVDYVFGGTDYLYYSPIMHPWSIWQFDHKAGTIEMMLTYLDEIGMECRLYEDVYNEIADGKLIVS